VVNRIKSLLRLIGVAFFYASVATIMFELALAGFYVVSGRFGKKEVGKVAAIVYEVDQVTLARLVDQRQTNSVTEMLDFESLAFRRSLIDLDLTLRETAIEKGLVDLRHIEKSIKEERMKFDQIKSEYELEMSSVGEDEKGSDTDKIRKMFEDLDPNVARDQLVRLLELADSKRLMIETKPRIKDEEKEQLEKEADKLVNDAVTIFRVMQLNSRKRLIETFKTEEQVRRLRDIFVQIQNGAPELPIIQRTREKLDDPNYELVEEESFLDDASAEGGNQGENRG